MQTEAFPFRNGGKPIPEERKEDVATIRSWLKQQEYLPEITDQFILLFLHSNYYHIEKTKKTIDSYFTVRAETPELFANWNYDSIQWPVYLMAPVPRLTPEGYKIVIYGLADSDPAKYNFQDALKAFFAFNDTLLSEDGLMEGYVVIFDMKNCSFGHLGRVLSKMHFFRVFMTYIQECHPTRLKSVHAINMDGVASIIDKLLAIAKPLMQSHLVQLLHLHSDISTLKQFLPLELLPEDLGGDSKSIVHLQDEHLKKMKSDYNDWMKGHEKLVADLKKRPKKGIINAIKGSFKTLSID